MRPAPKRLGLVCTCVCACVRVCVCVNVGLCACAGVLVCPPDNASEIPRYWNELDVPELTTTSGTRTHVYGYTLIHYTLSGGLEMVVKY